MKKNSTDISKNLSTFFIEFNDYFVRLIFLIICPFNVFIDA